MLRKLVHGSLCFLIFISFSLALVWCYLKINMLFLFSWFCSISFLKFFYLRIHFFHSTLRTQRHYLPRMLSTISRQRVYVKPRISAGPFVYIFTAHMSNGINKDLLDPFTLFTYSHWHFLKWTIIKMYNVGLSEFNCLLILQKYWKQAVIFPNKSTSICKSRQMTMLLVFFPFNQKNVKPWNIYNSHYVEDERTNVPL